MKNAFRYSIDYVLVDAEREQDAPWLFGPGRPFSVRMADHGGAPGEGRGAVWVREVLAGLDLPFGVGSIRLLTQPRFLGHVFNPVSFWLIGDAAGTLRIVIAEVTNTYGDRHSYLAHHDDFAPIRPQDRFAARKVMHVSPFQPVEGGYIFRFDIGAERIGIWIDYGTQSGGVYATLTGRRRAMTGRGLIAAALRRPLAARRVLALIHWQALKLWWKGARFRARPAPPGQDVSR